MIDDLLKQITGISCFELIDLEKGKTGDNYIAYSETQPDNIYADGLTAFTVKHYQFDLLTDKKNRSFFMNYVENLLTANGINFNKIPVGYNADVQRYQITYTFTLI